MNIPPQIVAEVREWLENTYGGKITDITVSITEDMNTITPEQVPVKDYPDGVKGNMIKKCVTCGDNFMGLGYDAFCPECECWVAIEKAREEWMPEINGVNREAVTDEDGYIIGAKFGCV